MTVCPHAAECSGCSRWSLEYAQELQEKTQALKDQARGLGYEGPVEAQSLGPIKIRDRADLQWRVNEGWGFLRKDFKTLKPIDQCPLFTDPLQELFLWWSQFSLKAAKASVRLRVDPRGRWGIWIDMANVEVKDLLQQDELLTAWTERAHVEVGQRFKVLRKVSGVWKLTDPQMHSWFSTIDQNQNPLGLYGSVGSFSQVGHAINHRLVAMTVQKALAQPCRQVVELGAGSGSFTLALAAAGFKVTALEQSASAVEGLQKALQDHPLLLDRIKSIVGNFQKIKWGEWSREPSVLFLDPPRSGVGEQLLNQIPEGNFPEVVYVACGFESWFKDGARLKSLGYFLKSLDWVDQFPHTLHYEIVSVWEKANPGAKNRDSL